MSLTEDEISDICGDVTERVIGSPVYQVGYCNRFGGGVSWPAVGSREAAEEELARRKLEGTVQGIEYWYIRERTMIARDQIIGTDQP